MKIKKLIVKNITIVTDSPSGSEGIVINPGEVESVSFPLTNGKMAQFDITDRGAGWIRFDSRQCLGRCAWNRNGSTEGDISGSDLQEYLDETAYMLLPAWLREMIMEVRRKTADGKEYCTCLFAPDASEVVKPNEDWYETRYQRLPYYTKAFNRIKVDLENEDKPVIWWSASAYSGNSTYAVIVYTYGMSYYYNVSDTFGVPLCFQINAADLGGLIREALNSGGTVRRIRKEEP